MSETETQPAPAAAETVPSTETPATPAESAGAVVTPLKSFRKQKKGVTAEDLIKNIVSRAKMALVERERDRLADEIAPEMFPFLEDDDGRDLTLEEERAVQARVKTDVDKFKAGLEDAIRAIPSNEVFVAPSGKVWAEGEPSPLPPPQEGGSWNVFCLYESEEVVRAYLIPTSGEGVRFACFTLSRHAPSYSGSLMEIDPFCREVSKEIVSSYLDHFGEDGHLAEDEEDDE